MNYGSITQLIAQKHEMKDIIYLFIYFVISKSANISEIVGDRVIVPT